MDNMTASLEAGGCRKLPFFGSGVHFPEAVLFGGFDPITGQS